MIRRLTVLMVVILTCTACVGSTNSMSIVVDLQCKDGETCEWGDLQTGCHGLGGYSDIRNGMKVTVRDGDGKVLASGDMKDSTGTCVFRASLDVKNSEYYQIEAGNRKPFVISKDEVESNDWEVRLSLGSYD